MEKAMIMLVTDKPDLREQLSQELQKTGEKIAVPSHRGDMLEVLGRSRPDLIVLDLYVADPSGVENLKLLRRGGYAGRIVVLTGPSQMAVLKEAYAVGVDKIVQVPTKIDGRFDLGNVRSAINMCLEGVPRP
jgi:CheY-like chemotaxis protein